MYSESGPCHFGTIALFRASPHGACHIANESMHRNDLTPWKSYPETLLTWFNEAHTTQNFGNGMPDGLGNLHSARDIESSPAPTAT